MSQISLLGPRVQMFVENIVSERNMFKIIIKKTHKFEGGLPSTSYVQPPYSYYASATGVAVSILFIIGIIIAILFGLNKT